MLTDLPNSIRIIDLSQNFVNKVFVSNAKLPESLENAMFLAPKGRLRFVCMEGGPVDPRMSKRQGIYDADFTFS